MALGVRLIEKLVRAFRVSAVLNSVCQLTNQPSKIDAAGGHTHTHTNDHKVPRALYYAAAAWLSPEKNTVRALSHNCFGNLHRNG